MVPLYVLGVVIIDLTILFAIIMFCSIEQGTSSPRRPQTARPPKRVCKYTGSCCSKSVCTHTSPCWSTEDMRRFRNDIGDYIVRKYYEDLRKEQEKQLYDSMLEELRKN